MAGSMNKVILLGRLGVDPQLKQTSQGTPVSSFSLARDESYTDKSGERVEKTEWHCITVWQRQAENVCEYLRKGSLALVAGRLRRPKKMPKTSPC